MKKPKEVQHTNTILKNNSINTESESKENIFTKTEEKETNNDILKYLRQTSLFFFFLIGITHILTGLMVSQEIMTATTNLINKILDIPFAMIATIFGLSHIKISSKSKHKMTLLVFMGTICLIVLSLFLYINILIPDKI